MPVHSEDEHTTNGQRVGLRGTRIELDELAAGLRGHPAVRESTLVLRVVAPGDLRLIAYVVPTTDDRPTTNDQRPTTNDEGTDSSFVPRPSSLTSELCAFLRERLPGSAMPADVVLVDHLQLAPGGQVDFENLPLPQRDSGASERTIDAPRNGLEAVLRVIWSALLGIEELGIHDHFFDLGGHSLLATQVVARVRDMLEIDLPVRSVFEAPTVAGMAEQIQTRLRSASDGVAAASGAAADDWPLSFPQQRLWLLDQFEPGNPAYNIPAAIRLSGILDLPACERSIDEIVRRHEVLRATFTVVDGRPVQTIAPRLRLAVRLCDLRQLPAQAREPNMRHLIAAEAQRPFDLARGPLLRVHLLRMDERDHVLLLTVHHIVADGWSMGIFLREFAALYAAFASGRRASASSSESTKFTKYTKVGVRHQKAIFEPFVPFVDQQNRILDRHSRDGRGEVASPLPPLPIQYADYAAWQHEYLQGEVLAAQLAYWRQQLAGAPPVLDLPSDYPRATVRTFRGAQVDLTLPPALSEALYNLSRQEKITLFMTLLAAFNVLLQRYSGQDDIVVGSPIAGRTRAETEGLIGMFLNTLVLRTDLSGTPSFRALLQRVRAVCLGAYLHQDLPFERLLEELQPERTLSHTPLFQVFFNMLNIPSNRVELPDLTMEFLATPEVASKFDLTLYVEEQGQQIELNLVYNADLFAPARMREMLEQFRFLLAQLIEEPDAPIIQASLVTPGACARLPDITAALDASWNGAIHTRFALQARLGPLRPAVMESQGTWTYAELDRWSNQLANYLIDHGIQPQDVVAVYGHRSAGLVWALLGVLKAGAAFMILDPAYPEARMIDYLGLAQPRAWVQLQAAGALPAALDAFVSAAAYRCRVELPQQPTAAANAFVGYAADGPAVGVGTDDLACVGFTSGSTGTPKGILGRHGPLTHFLPWQCATFALTESDRFSMLSGLSHDPIQRDIFTALWVGATICIPDTDQMRDPGQLVAWMARTAITVAHLTPALGQLLAEAPPDMRPAIMSLRYAFIVGDVLTRRDVAWIRAIAPWITCVNLYGSTETQRAVGYYIVANHALPAVDEDSRSTRAREVLPLGQGMPDVQLLVLNASQQLAGIGELGEIYVRSPHLARGYLGDDALTRERFLAERLEARGWRLGEDPAMPASSLQPPASRLYKTGDLGRYRPDGMVEFCGRADQQVQIRGFRVEPGEIEAVLARHPAVREAVVVAREDVPGDKRLVAYVVPTNDQRPTTNDRGLEDKESRRGGDKEDSDLLVSLSPPLISQAPSFVSDLRNHLKQTLPAYMVPAAFVLLDALPLTPNRKVDRKALPRPDDLYRETQAAYVAPQTQIERDIAAVWQEVLQVERVGLNDNFFELGGSSLYIVQMHTRLRTVLRQDIPIIELFNYPTIGALAHYLSRSQSTDSPFQELRDRMQKQKAAQERQRRLRPRS